MRKADDEDLRAALSEEVEHLEPSDDLWNKIYKRSVAQQEKKRNPWLKSALAMGAAAAAAALLLVNGQLHPGTAPQPPAGTVPPGLVQPLVAPGEPTPTTLPGPGPAISRFAPPDDTATRLHVRYNHTMYFYNGEAISADQLGDLLTRTTRETENPGSDGASNLLEPGREVRAIKGADPVQRIAVQTDQGWYVLDNMLKPLP